ncbi:21762_t:CDS:2 [Dentiscutata erythropus]|uniref:21762_t:CDS:1 n=1 Tax=Dentiscutata erythropus TaxID=1348616 RepID=A0A9N8W631_9GLOM|nr:21762_t:CDS:2 [Dentiscutata erythropus]
MVPHNDSVTYNLCQAFPHLSLTKHSNKNNYIAVCASCISANKHHNAPVLSPIPEVLANVLISLGHAKNTNQFTNYRHLIGIFGLSRNIHALHLYLEVLGTILVPVAENNWFHPTLQHAAN